MTNKEGVLIASLGRERRYCTSDEASAGAELTSGQPRRLERIKSLQASPLKLQTRNPKLFFHRQHPPSLTVDHDESMSLVAVAQLMARLNPKTEAGEHTRPGCGWTRPRGQHQHGWMSEPELNLSHSV